MYAIWLSVVIPLLVMILPIALERMQSILIDGYGQAPNRPQASPTPTTTP